MQVGIRKLEPYFLFPRNTIILQIIKRYGENGELDLEDLSKEEDKELPNEDDSDNEKLINIKRVLHDQNITKY